MSPRAPLPSLSISFVCFSSSRGGLELMLVRLAHSLWELGHSAFLVSPPGSAIEQESHRLGILHYALSPKFKYLDPRAAGYLRRYFIKHSTQVVVVGTSKDISTVVLVKKHLKSLRVAYFQQMQSGMTKKDLFHRWAYTKLDRWITLTKAMKESTLNNTIVHPSIIDVVPLGVDLKQFAPGRYRRNAVRKHFGLPNSKMIIGLVGRYDPQKGHETFLRAAPAILKRYPNAHFVLVGEETRGETGFLGRLRQLVEEEGIGSSVQFLPFTDQVPRLLSAFDLTTMPSYSETYGYLAIESMAMGIPVVGTNAGGLPEIIEDGKSGILVPPGDHRALAQAIVSLLSNRRRLREFSRLARKRALGSFDYNEGVRAFQESLFKALSAG